MGGRNKMFRRVNKQFILFAILIMAALSAAGQAPPAQTPPAPAGQAPPKLTRQEAEALAIKNHPQIQAAQNEVNYANQQIVVNRSAYYPNVTGELTGSQ